MFLQISQNSQGNTKKEILQQMFSCEFWEISHNIFFKKPYGRLPQHKHSFCLLSHHKLWWWWWWWWWWGGGGGVVFVVWLTDERRPALFPASEILTIANLRHDASRVWTCAEPEFRLSWMKLRSSDNHYTTAPRKRCHTYFLAEYVFGLIPRMGTRVSSKFQAFSKKPIFNAVENSSIVVFIQVLYAPLQVAPKTCSKVRN